MMKTLLAVLCVFFLPNPNFAATIKDTEDYEKAAQLVAKYLSKIVFEEEISRDASIKIVLKVTDENEIVVVTVDTPSNSIRRTIKELLNTKKIADGDLLPGKEYAFVLEVKAS